VSGPGTRSLGVLGAVQVDSAGNLNSTWSGDGSFVLGSGGANDVASGADDVVVVLRHSRHRLVEHVDYVTAPGKHVNTIVTSEAVLERRDGAFQIVHYLADLPPTEAVQAIRVGIGWDAKVASDLTYEPAPDPRDIALLRGFDPERVFLD
jgi:acyl CoA:acetate/3-ketoacid CoA transferase beta subunit